LRDLAKHWLREIETFFQTYKELEVDKISEVKGWHDTDSAWRLIEDARARAQARP
jgi:inorganic pyrophosphatase